MLSLSLHFSLTFFCLHVCVSLTLNSLAVWVSWWEFCFVFAVYVCMYACRHISRCCIYPGFKCVCVRTCVNFLSVLQCMLCGCVLSFCIYAFMCVWVRFAQSNYVIRAEPSGHLCGRPIQSAKDRLLDLFSPSLFRCVTGHHMDRNYHFLLSVSRCALMQHPQQLKRDKRQFSRET